VSLKQAILEVFQIQPDETPDLDLIVDGGGENNNTRIHNYIRHCHVNIQKKIALKDIRFSNLMIEGHFKILKRFLRSREEIHATNIHKEIEYFINDYNYHRPNYKHKYYTPTEVHENPKVLDITPIQEKASKEQLASNRAFCCKEI